MFAMRQRPLDLISDTIPPRVSIWAAIRRWFSWSVPTICPIRAPFLVVLDSGPVSFPLLPDVHPQSSPKPPIPFNHSLPDRCDMIVVQPAYDIGFDFLHDRSNILPLIASGSQLQLLLSFLQGTLVSSDVVSILILSHGIA